MCSMSPLSFNVRISREMIRHSSNAHSSDRSVSIRSNKRRTRINVSGTVNDDNGNGDAESDNDSEEEVEEGDEKRGESKAAAGPVDDADTEPDDGISMLGERAFSNAVRKERRTGVESKYEETELEFDDENDDEFNETVDDFATFIGSRSAGPPVDKNADNSE